MNYYNKSVNFIQSTPAPGLLEFPDEFMSIFYQSDKRAAGFVDITDDGQRVTSCVWDEEAYQKWCEANPEQPDPEPVPTAEERIAALEAKNEALTTSNQFLEDCLVEMSAIVYA